VSADQRLQPVQDSDELVVLNPAVAPLFEGVFDDGIDWLCPTCETRLATNMHVNEIIDLAIRCPNCQTVGLVERSPGQPIPRPGLRWVPGRYRFDQALPTPGHVCNVSARAIDAYNAETGFNLNQIDPGRLAVSVDANGLRDLATELADLLGDRYAALAASHAKGKTSKTPPAEYHPFLDLIDFANELAAELDADGDPTKVSSVNGDALAELIGNIINFRRWKNHPAFPSIVASLTSVTEVRHTTMLLGIASYLVDSGNSVELVTPDGQTGRIADIALHTSVSRVVDIELKTPQFLRAPDNQPLDLAVVTKEVEKLVDKAAKTNGGQLDPSRGGGIVAIGAYMLSPASTKVLKQAARDVLDKQFKQARKPHVMGVFVSVHGWSAPVGVVKAGQPFGFSPHWENELIQHEGYAGNVEIGQSELPIFGGPSGVQEPGPTTATAQPKVGRNRPCPCGSGKKFKRCHGAFS
jgi:hypothetical protein